MEDCIASDGGVLKRSVCASVDVNRIRWNLDGGDGIMKHRGVRSKYAPISLINAVASLATVNRSEIEGAMNEGVTMGEIYISAEGHEFMTRGIGFGCI